jgi:rubrerythrin
MPKLKDLQEIAEIISIAIAREQASIEYYKNAHRKATSENAKKTFSLLLEQERAHEAELRSRLYEIKAEIDAIKAEIDFKRMK